MNRKIACMLLTLSVFALLAGTRVYAQSSTKLTATIPFDFRVGSQSLPPGVYTVAPKSPSMVIIRSKDGHQSAVAQTNALQVNQASVDGKLIFNHYGGLYFLAQIWTPGEEVGRKLVKSSVEAEVAGGSSPSETTILIAGKVRK